jgi:hypothetical protein
MPLASNQLVFFQNCQWIYVILQTVWTSSMKVIMSRFHELHDQDGVILWFCFLQHFAGTTHKNLVQAYSQLWNPSCSSPNSMAMYFTLQMMSMLLFIVFSKPKKVLLFNIFFMFFMES